MKLDHIGIAVRSLDDGLEQWRALFGYSRRSDVVVNSRQQVKVVFLSREGSLPVKLIEPIGPGSPAFRFASKGGGLHHLCFRCASVEAEVARMQQQGALPVAPPQPGEAFNHHLIAFLLARNNLNIELIDTPEKAGWRPGERSETIEDPAPERRGG